MTGIENQAAIREFWLFGGKLERLSVGAGSWKRLNVLCLLEVHAVQARFRWAQMVRSVSTSLHSHLTFRLSSAGCFL